MSVYSENNAAVFDQIFEDVVKGVVFAKGL